MKNRKKIHDNWATPEYILNYIKYKYFGDNEFFDPCPLKPTFDGLSIEWKEYNFVNPPYNRKEKEAFINKAYRESFKNKVCVCLIPVSTSTKIFHEVILPNCDIKFWRGRIKFKGINSNGDYVETKVGQHGSMICVFRNEKYNKIKRGIKNGI